MRRSRTGLWAVFLVAFAPAVQALDFVSRAPVVFPIHLNTAQEGDIAPEIASDGRGDFVVAWRQDVFGTAENVVAEVLGIDGRRHDLQVTTAPFHSGQAWRVAMNRHGEFVVLYTAPAEAKISYQAKIFGRGRTPIGGAIDIVNADSVDLPSIGLDDAGALVVTWSDKSGVFVERFDRAGQPLGPRLVESPEPHPSDPTVVVEPDGSFTLAWHTLDASRDDKVGIVAQRFDRSGNPAGRPIVVHHARFAVSSIEGAATADGGFVLAWNSCENDLKHCQVQARRYDDRGKPLTPELVLSRKRVASFPPPAVAADSRGNFAVDWSSCSGADEPCTISVLLYDAANVRAEHVASLPSQQIFFRSGIAAGRNGFLVVYESLDCFAASCRNTPPTGIYGWRLDY
jgi:hypothetical protein